ncbi:unnamed protein product [Sphagnum compactum]
MASKVTFVNQNNKAQSFKVNLFGPARNRIKVVNVLAVFKASVVVMGDGSIMEADDNGLSMDTFKAGSTYTIAVVPIQESRQQTPQAVAGESPVVGPVRMWGTTAGEVRSFGNPNPIMVKEKHKGAKRSYRGTLLTLPDVEALEAVEPSSSHVGTAPLAHQDSTAHQHGEVGDLEAFLEGPSGERPGFSKEGTPPPEGESEEDVAGSTPCIDNGKASRGHTRCVKCGHSKNPSARLQCTHCGAFLREQTKARVAQRWATLKEKAKQEGRLGDKAWQRRKKYAFEKLTDLTLLDLENTYFALFISRGNREGDKFSYDTWYSEGAGHEFVTTGDVEARWKSFVKKHHKRKTCSLHGCDDTLDEEHVAAISSGCRSH